MAGALYFYILHMYAGKQVQVAQSDLLFACRRNGLLGRCELAWKCDTKRSRTFLSGLQPHFECYRPLSVYAFAVSSRILETGRPVSVPSRVLAAISDFTAKDCSCSLATPPD